MKKNFFWRSTVVIFAVLLLQLIYLTTGYAYCVFRDTDTMEVVPPDPNRPDDKWVMTCCDGRPAHWSSQAMPVPVYIYHNSPPELKIEIETAINKWNSIESSFFKMEIVGSTDPNTFVRENPGPGQEDHINGAIVVGFDPTICDRTDPECLYGGSYGPSQSVGPGWDEFQIQWVILYADATQWRQTTPEGRYFDPMLVMLHELGHAMAIMHPDSDPHGAGGAGCGYTFLHSIMDCCGRQHAAPYQNQDIGSLELDDIAAATSLYPKWKYTVEVVDSVNNPIQGAAVWMQGTCFPHDGDDRFEGGMVLGDIPSCLVGDQIPSPTYFPNITYATGPDGRTGAFRVLHNEFCFTVVADGYSDSSGCQPPLPAPGNYFHTVEMNRPPVCDANGPYTAECQGTTTVTVDGTGSSDPDPNDTLSYSWETDCPGGTFDDPANATPQLTINSTAACNASLTVTDSASASDSCLSTVTIQDTLAPSITCPSDRTIECDEPTGPSNTGSASATDVCDPSLDINYSDTVIPGTCPEEKTIARTWTATDDSGNSSSCVQTIEIVDTTPPVIDSLSVSPDVLWPPNHKMKPVTVSADVSDNCDSSPTVSLASIIMNEGDETSAFDPSFDSTVGDGHTYDDIQVDEGGNISLRAERSGTGTGRIYTITYSATDCSGNSSTADVTVTVPHNQ